MAIEYREVSERVEEGTPEYTTGARLMAQFASDLERHKLLPIRLPRAVSRPDASEPIQEDTLAVLGLGFVVAACVDRFIELGFHEEMGQTQDEYRAKFILSEGAKQPESYRGRFDVAVVVEPRIRLARLHERAGIRDYINTDNVTDITEYPKDCPYIIFTHDGQRYRPYSVEKALTLFEDDEVGTPQVEVTGFYLKHPEYLIRRGVDAAGSRYEGDDVPFFDLFYGRPKVIARRIDHVDYSWGPLSRGKEIIRLGVDCY